MLSDRPALIIKQLKDNNTNWPGHILFKIDQKNRSKLQAKMGRKLKTCKAKNDSESSTGSGHLNNIASFNARFMQPLIPGFLNTFVRLS